MSYILYGGIFDPPHRGHLEIAEAAYRAVQPNKVIWIPARRPPHRKVEGLNARERYTLVKLLIEDKKGFFLSDIELKGSHSGYTIETIRKFKYDKVGETCYLLIGTDEAEKFRTWKDWQKILNLCVLIIGKRKEKNNIPVEIKSRAIFLENKIRKISSSNLRKLFWEGEDVKDKVPRRVKRYITSGKLYSE